MCNLSKVIMHFERWCLNVGKKRESIFADIGYSPRLIALLMRLTSNFFAMDSSAATSHTLLMNGSVS